MIYIIATDYQFNDFLAGEYSCEKHDFQHPFRVIPSHKTTIFPTVKNCYFRKCLFGSCAKVNMREQFTL